MDWDKINNLYRAPSIYVSYQVSVHLAQFQRRRFLEIDQSETRIAYGCHVCLWIKWKWAIHIEDLEAHIEGSVLSFLKAEWKVSDTGSVHWASSFLLPLEIQLSRRECLDSIDCLTQPHTYKFVSYRNKLSWAVIKLANRHWLHVNIGRSHKLSC
jgi:hypothetical protein